MEARDLIAALTVAERLKDTTRHCYTSGGRHESVAEHSWMMCLMTFLLKDEFPGVDMAKVMEMCVIHDLGECFTGDIPAFDKDASHEAREAELLGEWVNSLPEAEGSRMRALYAEMEERETAEARLYKAIDALEAVQQHNLSDLATWIPHEYELNLRYGEDKVAFSDYLRELRAEIRKNTEKKIGVDL